MVRPKAVAFAMLHCHAGRRHQCAERGGVGHVCGIPWLHSHQRCLLPPPWTRCPGEDFHIWATVGPGLTPSCYCTFCWPEFLTLGQPGTRAERRESEKGTSVTSVGSVRRQQGLQRRAGKGRSPVHRCGEVGFSPSLGIDPCHHAWGRRQVLEATGSGWRLV